MVSRPVTSGHPIVQIQRQQIPGWESEPALLRAQRPAAATAFVREPWAETTFPPRLPAQRLKRRPRRPRRRLALSRPVSMQASAEDQRRCRRGRSAPPILPERQSGPATAELMTRPREESGPPLLERQA